MTMPQTEIFFKPCNNLPGLYPRYQRAFLENLLLRKLCEVFSGFASLLLNIIEISLE